MKTAKESRITGKERDAETGLDDFGARYYNSNLGRWITPDWSAHAAAVPYAIFTNPQTLNLYAYVTNNATTLVDNDGHLLTEFLWGTSGPQDKEPEKNSKPANTVEPTAQTGPAQATAAQKQKPQYQYPQNEAEARLANVVYNETSSLRVNPKSKPGEGGSAEALQDAREGIAEVAKRDMDSGHPERVAPSELADKDRRALAAGNADAISAHNASLAAAREALAGANNTSGDTQYRLRSPNVSPDHPINKRETNFVYGPFLNTTGPPKTIVFAR